MLTKYTSAEDRLSTPSDLVKTLSNSNVQRLDAEVLRVRGVYCRGAKNEPYPDGYYYDKLRDEVTKSLMILKVPEVWRPSLKNDSIYVLEGTLDRKVTNNYNELGIYLSFRVTNVVGEEAPLINEKLREAAEILSLRRVKPRRHIQAIVRECFKLNKKPRVAMICPRAGMTDADVDRAIEGQRLNYVITKVPTSLTNKTEIIQALRRLDEAGEYDLIAIYRGGGQGLDVFDDNNIARAVVEMKTPFVTAIGHAEDTPFIEMMADQAFTTPTALGHYLQIYAEEVIKDISWLARYMEDEKKYQQTIGTLREDLERKDTKYQRDFSDWIREKDDLQKQINGLYQEKSQHAATTELLNKSHRRKVVLLSLIFLLGGLLAGFSIAYLISRADQPAQPQAPIQTTEPTVNLRGSETSNSQSVSGKNNNSKRRN